MQDVSYEVVKLSEIHPADYNPRVDLQPGDVDYDRLKKSVMAYGLLQPIVVNRRTGNIIGGHQRYKILMDIGVESVICAVCDKDERDERAANLSLNNAVGAWEDDLLREMLENMDLEAIDPDTIGFDENEIEHILSGIGTLEEGDIFDQDFEPEKKEPMVKCPNCGKKFEERDNRV